MYKVYFKNGDIIESPKCETGREKDFVEVFSKIKFKPRDKWTSVDTFISTLTIIPMSNVLKIEKEEHEELISGDDSQKLQEQVKMWNDI